MTFSTNQVAEAAQISLRQLQWWDERRVVEPVHQGHRRVYDNGDFFKVLLLARMRAKGLSLQRIRGLLKSLPLEKLQVQKDAVMIIRKKGMIIRYEADATRNMDLEDGPVWVICIGPLLVKLNHETRRKSAQ